jgi:hypothetical protein
MEIDMLFPTPVASVDNTNFLGSEHWELLNAEYTEHLDSGFMQTTDSYILDSHAPELRQWIQDQLNCYSTNALATTDRLKITQSWCLKHDNVLQNVFMHSHCNSIVSGAYYVHADKASENIRFHKDLPSVAPNIKWENDSKLLKKQPWMWEWHEFDVITGRLILFPSYMYHSVVSKTPNNRVRCVLSFNTWFEGPIGSEHKLTRLGAVQ